MSRKKEPIMSINLQNYAIEPNVHLYRQGGLNLACDVNSGSIHLLDDVTFCYLQEWKDYQGAFPETIENPEVLLAATGRDLAPRVKEEILSELAELQTRKVLFSPELPEMTLPALEPPLLKALCLHVAHDCNLRCRYCFAKTGSFGGQRAFMSEAIGKKALDMLILASGSRPYCEVDFFGGEPLLAWPLIKELVAYGREREQQTGKQIKFTLTTNAILLDAEVQAFLDREKISLVLSLDGRPEVNDRMRPFPDRSGSYARALPHIIEWVRRYPDSPRFTSGSDVYYYVRGTFTRHNLDFYRDVLHMAALGIERISLEPVVAEAGCDYALTEEDVPALLEAYDILGEEACKGRFTFFHFNVGLAEGPCLAKRLSGCGAGYEYVAISPEGDIFPCHQFVGQEAYKLGSLAQAADGPFNSARLDKELVETFRGTTIYTKEACRRCWARFSCSGGCHASNLSQGGGLREVYPLGCILQKKRLEVACYVQVQQQKSY